MRITHSTTLTIFALVVGDALRRAGIRAVLTGGACAGLHTGGAHTSVDADFILLGEVERPGLDAALAGIGFRRMGDRYVHPESEFYVEFPRGPLAIGSDDDIRPVDHRIGRLECLALSATDSCRDRLAAYYHWNDRQSLEVAIRIALQNRVAWRVLREWSREEGFLERYDEFLRMVRANRRRGA